MRKEKEQKEREEMEKKEKEKVKTEGETNKKEQKEGEETTSTPKDDKEVEESKEGVDSFQQSNIYGVSELEFCPQVANRNTVSLQSAGAKVTIRSSLRGRKTKNNLIPNGMLGSSAQHS